MLERITQIANQMANDPIHQFVLKDLIKFEPAGINLNFTNSALFMVVGVALASVLFLIFSSKSDLVPGRGQSLGELTYGFLAKMVRDIMGEEGMRFFPLVFSIFVFILFANLIGMWPHFFTTTSHVIVNLALGSIVILTVVLVGLWKHGIGWFKLFFPSGMPWPLYILITPIEIVSFLSRPFSLAIRLFANMLAGHIALKVFAGFVGSLLTLGALGIPVAIAAFLGTTAIVALEFMVAFIQAFVFTILTCIYLNDALHPGH